MRSCSSSWKLLQPYVIGIFNGGFLMQAWSIINSISSHSLLSRDQDGKFQASNHGVVFLVAHSYPEATQEPTQSYLIRTKDCYHLGNSKGFRRPASGMGGFKDQILEQKMLLVLLSLRKLQGFPLCQEPGADISVHLFFISHYYTLWVNSEHRHHQMLARMWSNRNPHSMLLEMQNGTATQKTIWWFPFLN